MDSADFLAPLLPEPLPADPFPLFVKWFDEAAAKKVVPNPNSMALATVGPDGRPSVRIVLCKGIDAGEGRITFYTNYESDKGRALAANPRAEAVFHWDVLDRQVRISGPIVKSPAAESDEYFASRPWMSRVAACASEQSKPIASREELVVQLASAAAGLGVDLLNLPPENAKLDIPRPPHWGGFRLIADRVELWSGSKVRLHDRAAWTRRLKQSPGTGGVAAYIAAGGWTATRLQP